MKTWDAWKKKTWHSTNYYVCVDIIFEIKILGVQCDSDPLLEENLALKKELEDLRKEHAKYKWSVAKIADDDVKTKYYTGLPSFAVFMWLFKYV